MLKLIMDNIVGSRIGISKHETKAWALKKLNLYLTEDQIALIVGSLPGDATMRIGHDSINANFKIEHGLEQKALVFAKYEILKPWVFTQPKISYRYYSNGEKYQKSWWFRTVRHPKLTEFQNIFYPNRKKIVPRNILNLLNESALAWWIMDDGSYNQSKIDISTYSFSLTEIQRLLKVFKDKFNIQGNYYRDRDKGYRIYFNVLETKKLIPLIEPYVVASMRYKIGYSKS
jgi:hypothetical protein